MTSLFSIKVASGRRRIDSFTINLTMGSCPIQMKITA